MTRISSASLEDLTFQASDTPSARLQKLERMRAHILDGLSQRTAYFSITEGLPSASPTEPLVRLRFTERMTLGALTADAGNAASATVALRIFKDGVANGTITFTGTVGTAAITDPVYEAGSLFEIYPPTTADPTLDDLSISLSTTVG